MITVEDVENAQQEWGEGVVAIAHAHSSGADYIGRARTHVESLYAYGITPVLFKPTMAVKEPFRSSFEGALSYFVASNNECLEDTGFAIKGWINVRFENENIVINGDTAMAMGNYFFITLGGEELKVEFSFGYILDSSGDLRIQLHHSSMPASLE